MPKGSVRAILLGLLTSAIIGAMFQNIKVPSDVMTIWAAAFGLYFGSRENQNKS